MQKFGRFLLAAGVVAASIGLWRYVYLDSLERSDVAEEKKPPAPLAVEVVPVREQSINETIELVGSLDAGMRVEIRSRVDGYIKQIPFDVGDRVEVGEDVVVLDDSSQQELISRAAASLRVAEAQLQAQQTELTFAERNAERQRMLMQSGAGTTSQLDAAESAVQIAAAKVELERARVAEAQSNLDQMRLELADLRLNSPFRVSSRSGWSKQATWPSRTCRCCRSSTSTWSRRWCTLSSGTSARFVSGCRRS